MDIKLAIMATVAISILLASHWYDGRCLSERRRNISFVASCITFITMWIVGSKAVGIASLLIGTFFMLMGLLIIFLIAVSFSFPAESRLTHPQYYAPVSVFIARVYFFIVWVSWWAGSILLLYILMKESFLPGIR